jgi:hypothetical protein
LGEALATELTATNARSVIANRPLGAVAPPPSPSPSRSPILRAVPGVAR